MLHLTAKLYIESGACARSSVHVNIFFLSPSLASLLLDECNIFVNKCITQLLERLPRARPLQLSYLHDKHQERNIFFQSAVVDIIQNQ